MIKKLRIDDLPLIIALGDSILLKKSYWEKEFNYPGNVAFGYFKAGLQGVVSAYVLADQVQISVVYVREEARKQGIGQALVQGLITSYLQIDNFNLEVRESNKGAIRLYQKMGFKVVAKRKNYYHNPLEDGLLMVRERKDINEYSGD